jgi:cytochrome oxidase Cu insertion factor (SCO1/SenC/PrrC family)
MLVVPAEQACPPALLGSYRRLLAELPHNDVRVLAITTEPADPLLRGDVPGVPLLDRSGSVASQYMVRQPTWFVIDADGTIRHRVPASPVNDTLLTAIRSLIAPEVPVPLPGNV